jgi:hypothetical protein
MGKRPIKYFLILIIVTSQKSAANSHGFRKTTLISPNTIYLDSLMDGQLVVENWYQSEGSCSEQWSRLCGWSLAI